MKKKALILIMLAVFLFNGCSIMPYQENFSCSEDVNAGSCKMVRDNYNQ